MLELGAGCGVAGLAVARHVPGARVVLTDHDDAVLANLQRSAQGGVDVSLLDRFSVRTLMSVDLAHVALSVVTPPADVLILELIALSPEYAYEYEWVAQRTGRIDAIAYWFVIGWGEGCEPTETLAVCSQFPGAPHGQKLDVKEGDASPPHWRQAAWMLEQSVAVSEGQVVRVRVSCVGSYLSFSVVP